MTKDKASTPTSELRRSILKRIGTAIGVGAAGIVTNASISSAAAFYQQDTNTTLAQQNLSTSEMLTLRSICETVIPKTDTPSAADVNCHKFIAHQLNACHSSEEQKNVVSVINAIDTYAKNHREGPFISLNNNERTTVLESLEASDGFEQSSTQQFSFLKGLIVFGYFTSEAGATKALSYQMVPGGYKGSIPVTPETRSWGSLNYY